jgi:hypothetical protein
MLQYGTFLADGLVIFLIVPYIKRDGVLYELQNAISFYILH